MRYAAIVQQKGGKVIISCYQEFEAFVQADCWHRASGGADGRIVRFSSASAADEFARILGTTLENIRQIFLI